MTHGSMLELAGVVAGYQRSQMLHGVDLDVAAGGVLGGRLASAGAASGSAAAVVGRDASPAPCDGCDPPDDDRRRDDWDLRVMGRWATGTTGL